VRCINGEGNNVWVEVKGCCLYDKKGKAIKMMGTIKDVTAQKTAEEEVNHLSLAVENAMTGISWLDKDGFFRMVRAGYAEILGYTPDELIGKSWTVTVPDKSLDKAMEVYQHMLAYGKTDAEVLGLRKDQVVFHKQLLLVKTFDEDGQHNGHYCFMRNIDERKGFEQEIQNQNAELKQINYELDNFVYRVSHDLRAPLSSTLGLVELCLNSSDQNEIKQYLQLQQKSLKKLDSFIQDILDYSRNNRREVVSQEVKLEEVLEEILMLNEEYKSTVDRSVKLEQKAPFISDPMRIRILLNNLISNAFKFSSPHRHRKSYVDIQICISENFAEINIQDNGIGIAKEHLNKIFEMFYRATDFKPGSGIGLYIVHESVKKLGGSIKVRSELGKGTSFHVVIPNMLD